MCPFFGENICSCTMHNKWQYSGKGRRQSPMRKPKLMYLIPRWPYFKFCHHNVRFLFWILISDYSAGCSVDWAKAVAGFKYSFTVELRDQGEYGFLLPPSGYKLQATALMNTKTKDKTTRRILSSFRSTFSYYWYILICILLIFSVEIIPTSEEIWASLQTIAQYIVRK
jgi:hypothetical protein